MSLNYSEGRYESSSKSDKFNPVIIGLLGDITYGIDDVIDIKDEPLKDPLFLRGNDGREYKTDNDLADANWNHLISCLPRGIGKDNLIIDNPKSKHKPKIHVPNIYLN